MEEKKSPLPVPDLDPRRITLDEYMAFTPEKLELVSGYLIHPPHWTDARRELLALLLVNVGLAEAVKLAPESRWREALERVYGAPAR